MSPGLSPHAYITSPCVQNLTGIPEIWIGSKNFKTNHVT